MHPRQASVLSQATKIADRLAAAVEKKKPLTPLLWKYTDPDGKVFYLDEKKLTIKSPFSGKTFPARPERHTPAQVGKVMKDEAKADRKTASDIWKA